MARPCRSLSHAFLLHANDAGMRRMGMTEDRPCDASAKSSQKAFTATGPSSALAMNVVNRFYDVHGLDATSLARSMDANGPKGFHGLASWKIDMNYDFSRNAKDCQITAVRVKIIGEILMPRWVDEPKASLEMQRQWAESYNKLKRHEDGHVNHGRELALLVKEKLMGLGIVACDKLQTQAQQSYEQLFQNLSKRDQEYDARTNHGLN